MTIYLLRHGIAEDRAASGADADRALTREGIAKLETVLRVAAGAGVAPSLILSSPYVRAIGTARVAARVLGVDSEIVESVAFTPNASPATAWEEIRTWQSEREILIATHEPIVSGLLSFLLGVSEYIHDFKKAGLAKIEVTRSGARPAGTIKWILTPALAAAIAKG